jgi:hypothetical protein
MGKERNLAKLASSLNSEGIISAASGGTGTSAGPDTLIPTITAITYPGDDTAVAGSRNYNVTNSGASDYAIDGTNDPSLTLLRGFTYTFSVNASGHPFWIKTAQVTGTGSAYSSGVTNNGTQVGTVTFTVPLDAPSTLYYICQFHGSMSGIINIIDVGSQTITLTGSNFNTGVKVVINGIQLNTVTRISSTQLTFTAPPNVTGSYIVYVVNTDGTTALAVPGIQYSGVPAWTTAAGTLGSPRKFSSFTTTLAATGDAPITYSLLSGTLPSGITLNSTTGVLSGTAPNITVSTTYTFTIRSTDAQNQDTDRSFSITVDPTNPPPSVSYIIIGGGGGGSDRGGGGGGGLETGTLSPVQGTPYTVEVGAGGAGAGIGPASSGGASYFNNTYAGGGGGGGAGGQGYGSPGTGLSASNGGCGGGAGMTTSGAQPSAAGGGSGYTSGGSSAYQFNVAGAGGGGGGRGGSGTNGTIQTLYNPNGSVFATIGYSGNGGNGVSATDWGLGTVCGGGAGSGGQSGTAGSGSGSSSYGGGGTAGYGGGGGGAAASAQAGPGIVKIRYADTYDAAASAPGATVTVSGGYRTYTFTSGSSSITF